MGRQETCHLLHLSKAKLGQWILFWHRRVLQEIFHLHDDATLKNVPWLAALELNTICCSPLPNQTQEFKYK